MNGWEKIIHPELQKDYMKNLSAFLREERKTKKIFPLSEDVFNAFKKCPLDKLKCVWIGMDPYPGECAYGPIADGLAFSTRDVRTPTSLRHIHKAIEESVYKGFTLTLDNDLTYLAEQGVLLLNSCLTVEKNLAGSHAGRGWETFVGHIINETSKLGYPMAYIYFGKQAQSLIRHTDQLNTGYHKIIRVEHPAYASYSGRAWNHEDCFNRVNTFLQEQFNYRIEW